MPCLRSGRSFVVLAALTFLAGCARGPMPGLMSGTGSAVPPSSGPATLEAARFTEFGAAASVSDLEIPDAPALRGLALVAEDRGTVRILDLGAGQPSLVRALDLAAGGLPSGVATGDLTVVTGRTAAVTTAGAGFEAVHLFDPRTATGPASFTRVDVPGQATPAGGAPFAPSFTSAVEVAGGKLFVATSNLDPQTYAYNPGTVFAWTFAAATNSVAGAPAVVWTQASNPVDLKRIVTSSGNELLLVLCAGSYGGTDGSIDVVDPVTLHTLGTFPLGANPAGEIAVTPDGTRAFIGSSSASALYQIDIDGLDGLLGAAAPQSLAGGVIQGGANPVIIPRRHPSPAAYVSEVAVSDDGRLVYAIEFNDSTLAIFDRVGDALTLRERVGFERTSDPTQYQNNASLLAVRPGVAGRDFRGPSRWVMTINLAAADRAFPDVSVVLDAVSP